MKESIHKKWLALSARGNEIKHEYGKQYPGMYLLMCVHTQRFAIGDPRKDEQGGYKDASDNFDAKYGSLRNVGERWRDFFGTPLPQKENQ